MGERFFFLFQIPLSHNNNHLTAPCGLAAASDVEAEREKGGGGGGGGGSLCGWTVTNPVHYNAAHWITDRSPTTPPRFALSVRYRVCAHTHAFHLSISGPDLGQVSFLRLSLSGHSALVENLLI